MWQWLTFRYFNIRKYKRGESFEIDLFDFQAWNAQSRGKPYCLKQMVTALTELADAEIIKIVFKFNKSEFKVQLHDANEEILKKTSKSPTSNPVPEQAAITDQYNKIKDNTDGENDQQVGESSDDRPIAQQPPEVKKVEKPRKRPKPKPQPVRPRLFEKPVTRSERAKMQAAYIPSPQKKQNTQTNTTQEQILEKGSIFPKIFKKRKFSGDLNDLLKVVEEAKAAIYPAELKPNLRQLIAKKEPSEVRYAIEILKQGLDQGRVRNAPAYLYKALKDGWCKNNDSVPTEEKQTGSRGLSEWVDLARRIFPAIATTIKDGVPWVYVVLEHNAPTRCQLLSEFQKKYGLDWLRTEFLRRSNENEIPAPT